MVGNKTRGAPPRGRRAVPTFDVPGQVHSDHGKGCFSFQVDIIWVQFCSFKLESPAEGSWYSWHVREFQHLLLTRCNEALQGCKKREGMHQSVWWGMAQGTDRLRGQVLCPHHLCDKYITVLALVIVKVNTMCFIMLTFVREVLLKFRVLLMRMLCCDTNVDEELM